MNNEAWRATKKEDPTKKGEQEETGGDEGVWDPEKGIFGKVTYVRSVYEGKVD